MSKSLIFAYAQCKWIWQKQQATILSCNIKLSITLLHIKIWFHKVYTSRDQQLLCVSDNDIKFLNS